jgi:hypothetical protein
MAPHQFLVGPDVAASGSLDELRVIQRRALQVSHLPTPMRNPGFPATLESAGQAAGVEAARSRRMIVAG